MSNDGNKLNRIEELKSKLFSKNYQVKIEHRDNFSHLHRKDIPDAWESGAKIIPGLVYRNRFFMKTSVFKNFFIFSLVFFVLTLGYASYVFFAGGNNVSNDNIDISILGNNFIAGGKGLALVVGITNKNNSALDLVDLVLEYQKAGKRRDKCRGSHRRFRQSLGTIPAGSSTQ